MTDSARSIPLSIATGNSIGHAMRSCYVPLFGVTQSNVDLRNYVISRQIVI